MTQARKKLNRHAVRAFPNGYNITFFGLVKCLETGMKYKFNGRRFIGEHL